MKLNTRAARRELMIEIIRNNAVASQSELVEESLRERGSMSPRRPCPATSTRWAR